MKFLRLEHEVPEIYAEHSRDFQLLCRLYGFIVNSTKYDVDNIDKIINTHEIRTNLLPLLQTKIGFFSNASIDDTALRLVLETFALMVKKKGSLKSIEWAINVFLKILNLRVSIIITKTEAETQFYNINLPDHTIVIGLNSAFRGNASIFGEMLKYLLPAGFGYFMYFYTTFQEAIEIIENDKVSIIYVSDDISSAVRGEMYKLGIEDRILGNVSLTGVVGNDYSETKESIDIIQEIGDED